MTTTITPVNAQKVWVFSANGDGTLSPTTFGGGGSGSVTNIATTSPITGGPITTTGTIACATCTTNAAALTANNLVIGGGAQATSALGSLGTTTTVLHGNAAGAPSFGAVVLSTDVSGQLPIGNVGSSGLSGTSPVTISAAGAIGCATCNTSAGSLTNNTVLKGAGTQGIQLSSITDDGTTITLPEITTFTKAGAASTNSVKFNGTLFTGGSGTTTFPNVFIDPGGNTAPTTFSVNGTLLGFNAPTGFTGKMLDAHLNGGGTVFSVDQAGGVACGTITGSAGITAAAGSNLGLNARTQFRSAADGRVSANNNGNTSGGMTRFTFGTEAASNPAFAFDGSTATVKTADGGGTTANGIFSSAVYKTDTACASSGGTCAASAAGFVSIAAAATTVTVATTRVTANSQILVTEDATLGTALSVTCNTATGRTYTVTTRTAGTSFILTSSAAPSTNPACLSFYILN